MVVLSPWTEEYCQVFVRTYRYNETCRPTAPLSLLTAIVQAEVLNGCNFDELCPQGISRSPSEKRSKENLLVSLAAPL